MRYVTKVRIKTFFDILLTLFLPLYMCAPVVGELVHTVTGVLLMLIYIISQTMDRRVYPLKPEECNFIRYKVLFAIRIILSVLITISVLSAFVLLIEQNPFAIFGYTKSTVIRMHAFSTCWCFALMGIQIGYSIRAMMSAVINYGRNFTLLVHLFLGIVSLYGVYSFIGNNFIDYMFLRDMNPSFIFNGNPIILFFQYESTMIMFIFLTHHILREIDNIRLAKTDQS